MSKLMEIWEMFVEFLRNFTEFNTLELLNNSEKAILEVYYPCIEKNEYSTELKNIFGNGFSKDTELEKNKCYCLYVIPKSNDLDKNEDLKKKIRGLLEKFKEKGFKIKYSRYFFDSYYGILEL